MAISEKVEKAINEFWHVTWVQGASKSVERRANKLKVAAACAALVQAIEEEIEAAVKDAVQDYRDSCDEG